MYTLCLKKRHTYTLSLSISLPNIDRF